MQARCGSRYLRHPLFAVGHKLADALPRLADTADELNAVAQKLGVPASDIFLRANANETTVKRLALADYRVVYFATELWPGKYSVSYVARATTPGIFVRPPATATEMYNPAVQGRTDGGVFTVTQK